jgi:hypothetical protein
VVARWLAKRVLEPMDRLESRNDKRRCGWRIVNSRTIPQGSPSCYAFCDAQSGRSVYPLDRHLGPVARPWRRPFPSCGVPSPQAPTAHRESLPATIAQSAVVGPRPRRLAGALGASNSSAPFRNCAEALDTASPSQSHEQAKVRMLFSPNRRRMPGPKGPSAESSVRSSK